MSAVNNYHVREGLAFGNSDISITSWIPRRFHALQEVPLPDAPCINRMPELELYLKFTLEHVAVPWGPARQHPFYEVTLAPGEWCEIPKFCGSTAPSMMESYVAANGTFRKALTSEAGASNPRLASMQREFPPRELAGDFGLVYEGPDAPKRGTEILNAAIYSHVKYVSTTRRCEISEGPGKTRRVTNQKGNMSWHLLFYQLVQEYLSIISCVDIRIFGRSGASLVEAPLINLDRIRQKFCILGDAWEAIRSAVTHAIFAGSPAQDHAGRLMSMVGKFGDGEDSPRLRPTRYLEALAGIGISDGFTERLRAVRYNPTGNILCISKLDLPVEGNCATEEFIPISKVQEMEATASHQ